MFEKIVFSVIFINYLISNNVNALMNLNTNSSRVPFDMQLYEDVLDPELCQQQLVYLTTDTRLLARFLEAGLRIPRGILLGNTLDLGNYHQCMNINEEVEDMAITGKYCRIRVPVEQDIRLPNFLDRSRMKFDPSQLHIDKKTLRQLEVATRQKGALKTNLAGGDILRVGPDSLLADLSFNLAICIPRPCSTEQAINGLLFNLTEIGFEYSDISCRLPDDRPWAAADYVATVVFSIIGFLTILSTSYDLYLCVYMKKGKNDVSPAYTSFSVYTNGQRLLDFSSSPSLQCLDGIRALAMIWVILGHSFAAASDTINPLESFQWSISANAIWVTVSPLTVDTFFFVSGLLLVYTTVGKFGRMQLLKNLHVFYLHRLLRMFPILASVVLFESSFFMRIADGPLWDSVAVNVLRCREFWWSTLLYVQNLVVPRDTCVGVSWYLAIDIQLHILSPIVLFWVLTSKRAAWTALNTTLVVTLTASTIYVFFHNFPSGIISPNRQNEPVDYLAYYYVNTLTRASPFLVGMVYGYLLHLWRKKEFKVPKIITQIFLLLSLLLILVVMYSSYIAMTLEWDNQLADNFFNSFLRSLWALALGWIVFACVQGAADPINWFLTHKMWKLPARLSYAMYLTHLSAIVAFHSSLYAPIYFTVGSIMFNFMGFMLTTIIISFFITLLIDSPFSILFKLLLDRGHKKSQSSKVTLKENDLARNDNFGHNFDADEDNKKQQPLSTSTGNGDLKLNINGGGNTSLNAK